MGPASRYQKNEIGNDLNMTDDLFIENSLIKAPMKSTLFQSTKKTSKI